MSQSPTVPVPMIDTWVRVESWNVPTGPSHCTQATLGSRSASSSSASPISKVPDDLLVGPGQGHGPAEPGGERGVVGCDRPVRQGDAHVVAVERRVGEQQVGARGR